MGPDNGSLDELRRLAVTLRESRHRSMVDEKVRAAHDGIMAILDSVRRKRDIDRYLRHPGWQRMREELTLLNADVHLHTEIDLARRYVTSKSARDPFEGSWINKGFTALLAGQIARWRRKGLLRGRERRIVIVGGGALPQTQVALHRALDAEVVSVDRDSRSVEACRAVLKKAGLGYLSVVESDGAAFDFSGTHLVVVATLVTGKHLVARRVAETSQRSFFAPRTPLRLHCMWRELLDERSICANGWRRVDFYAPLRSSVGTLLFTHTGGSDDGR